MKLAEYWEFRAQRTSDPYIKEQLQKLVNELKRIEERDAHEEAMVSNHIETTCK